MPFTSRIDPALNLGVVVYTGILTGPEILASVRAIAEDPAWTPDLNTLWDGRGIRQLVVEPAHVQEIVAYVRPLREKVRTTRTAVITWRELDRMSTQLIAVASGGERDRSIFFSTLSAALDHLGLTQDEVRHLVAVKGSEAGE